MDLDEMKQSWQARDRALDARLRLNARLLRAATLDRAETALRRLSRRMAVELALSLAAVLWLGAFAARHGGDIRFLAPAVVLGLCGAGFCAAAIHQLVAIRTIDYGGPVLAIQARLERLRVQRLRADLAALVLGPLLWVAVLVVAVKGLLGADVYAMVPGRWLVANVLFGVAVLVAAVWAARRYAGRAGHSPTLRRVMRDLAGHNLTQAMDVVRELREFEQEDAAA
ncbi:hypothetical protein [Longimicrobium sp.]|uniref:hypothetical protein n=1 Tax=Longimicrobium sp. TaxID=2029185 RepID=UPI002E30CAA4|nr:hypothetical protein [Longimicrobium sp.]HEX6039200.1 hypothetical protein [Longimicrobium sp.]